MRLLRFSQLVTSSMLLIISTFVLAQAKETIKSKRISIDKIGRVRRDAVTTQSPGTDDIDLEDVNRPDPFPLSLEWANFVKRTDQITENLKKGIEKLIQLLSDKNQVKEYASNKSSYLTNFPVTFSKEFQPFADFFAPLQEQLDLNKAYTIFDPAVGLETLEKCYALVRSNPSKDIDKARLKWIEVNAMATTIHHIFNRLPLEFEEFGVSDIGEALSILYPSWTTVTSQNETGNTYVDMAAREMIDFIDMEINSLGDPNHLIRVLEKLLQKKVGLKGWDPSKTNLNKYCYGNNVYGLIHDKFDVVIDAAQYLVMADMKYAVVQITHEVYKAYQIENSGGDKPNLQLLFDSVMSNMTTRIDKKIKFSKLAEIPSEVAVIPGPTVFKCDPTPMGCEGLGSKVTAPNCPPGVYIQNWKVYELGQEMTIPQDVLDTVKLSSGSPIGCLALEVVAFSSNGSVLPCKILNQTCIDGNGTEIKDEQYTIQIIPILIDINRVPYHRDVLTETYPETGQWGKFDCSKDPGHWPSLPHGPTALVPPTDLTSGGTELVLPPPEWNCTVNANTDIGPGYIDCRPPALTEANTAEFTMAFPTYFESELVLNPNGKCIGTCADYKNPTPTCTNKTTHCDLYRRSHCQDNEDCMKQSQCSTKAKRCIRTSRQVTFCPAAPGTGKLYDWFTLDGHSHQVTTLAEKNNSTNPVPDVTKCSTNKIMKANERWEMEEGVILTTPQYCELCLCICSDAIGSDGRHFFDTAPIVADTDAGYVVSGLRFERHNKTLLLNIQQGRLLANGKVDPETLTWHDLTTGRSATLVPLGPTGFDKLNLDIIEPGTPTEVLTAIQWKVNQNTLSLQGGFNSFDGKLSSGPPIFRGAKFPPPKENRDRFDLRNVESPVKQHGPSQPYPITDNSKYIEFDASSLEKDRGQAIIPFFDLQPLTSPDGHARPLRNVGILYKSKFGSGGFIAPSAKF